MFETKNLLFLGMAVAVIGVFGYILLLMLEPSPYPGIVAAQVKSDNAKAASQVLATLQADPDCGKLDIPRDSLLKYYKSQECFMVNTEIRRHRPPTRAQLLSHGKAFIAGLSSKLNMCLTPEAQHKLLVRIESGKNLTAFLNGISPSRDLTDQLRRISHKMMCRS